MKSRKGVLWQDNKRNGLKTGHSFPIGDIEHKFRSDDGYVL
jgi:hypothetical protein